MRIYRRAEHRAQDIAFYSQLVDDFNYSWLQPGSCLLVSVKPPQFFFDNKLAMNHTSYNHLLWFYSATTGISKLQSFWSTVNKSHQLLTIIPFHFIPRTTVGQMSRDDMESWRCVKADGSGQTLIETLLKKLFDSKEVNDMRLGLLLHIYADTYSHQMFSGRWGNENAVSSRGIWDRSCNPPREVKLDLYARTLPAIGHAELEHVPDVFAFEYTAAYDQFAGQKDYIYHRYNMNEFMECAYNILTLLREYNHQQPIDKNYFDSTIAPAIRSAAIRCVKGASEITDASELAKIWRGGFPEDPDYSKANLYKCYKPTQDLYRYNEIAYRHIEQVMGTYRREYYE